MNTTAQAGSATNTSAAKAPKYRLVGPTELLQANDEMTGRFKPSDLQLEPTETKWARVGDDSLGGVLVGRTPDEILNHPKASLLIALAGLNLTFRRPTASEQPAPQARTNSPFRLKGDNEKIAAGDGLDFGGRVTDTHDLEKDYWIDVESGPEIGLTVAEYRAMGCASPNARVRTKAHAPDCQCSTCKPETAAQGHGYIAAVDESEVITLRPGMRVRQLGEKILPTDLYWNKYVLSDNHPNDKWFAFPKDDKDVGSAVGSPEVINYTIATEPALQPKQKQYRLLAAHETPLPTDEGSCGANTPLSAEPVSWAAAVAEGTKDVWVVLSDALGGRWYPVMARGRTVGVIANEALSLFGETMQFRRAI